MLSKVEAVPQTDQVRCLSPYSGEGPSSHCESQPQDSPEGKAIWSLSGQSIARICFVLDTSYLASMRYQDKAGGAVMGRGRGR